MNSEFHVRHDVVSIFVYELAHLLLFNQLEHTKDCFHDNRVAFSSAGATSNNRDCLLSSISRENTLNAVVLKYCYAYGIMHS